jgi:multidrug efflux pump subunit AcrA (membrane-fusion protein)
MPSILPPEIPRYCVDAANVIRRSAIVTGLETAQRIEVRSGLNAGDTVVVGRHAGLRDGQHVQTKLSEVIAEGNTPEKK